MSTEPTAPEGAREEEIEAPVPDLTLDDLAQQDEDLPALDESDIPKVEEG